MPTVTAEDGLRHCQELLQTRRQFRLVRAMLAKMPHLSGVELPVQGGSCMSDGKRLLQQLQPGVRFELLDRRDSEKKMTPAGLEPAIPGSVGRCLIHWATGPDVRARSEAIAMVDVHRKTACHIIYPPRFKAQPQHEADAPLGIQNMTPCKRIEHLNATRRRARQI